MAIKEISKSIVVVGSFNPAIFQPAWIAQNSLLPEEEMDGFYNEQIVKKIPEFGLEIGTGQPFQVNNDQAVAIFKSFSLQVVRNRFSTTITSDDNTTIKFIRKVFKMLPETPIHSYGINFNVHIEFVEDYNEIIDNLFDRKPLFLDSFGNDVELGFTMKSKFKGSILKTSIERSVKSENGIYLASNFHHDTPGGVKEFNSVDLRSQYLESEQYLLHSLINGLGQLKG